MPAQAPRSPRRRLQARARPTSHRPRPGHPPDARSAAAAIHELDGPERRTAARVATQGTVIFDADRDHRGRVVDLSLGGIRVRAAAVPPRLGPGVAVTLQLRLDGVAVAWIELGGVVCRADRAPMVALSFTEIPDGFAALVAAQHDVAAARAACTRVLLVAADPARRLALAGALRGQGCAVAEATTPLDTLVYLGETDHGFGVVAIADLPPGVTAAALAAFVGDAEPHLPVLVLPALSPTAAAAAILAQLAGHAPRT
jgi:hypothetical protein